MQPAPPVVRSQMGCVFSDVQELTQAGEFYQGFLEMSNVNKINILLEMQNVLLKMAQDNTISQEIYMYDLILCWELFDIYSKCLEENFLISFSEQVIDNTNLMHAKEILKRLTLK